jgi:hypothetical protein
VTQTLHVVNVGNLDLAVPTQKKGGVQEQRTEGQPSDSNLKGGVLLSLRRALE